MRVGGSQKSTNLVTLKLSTLKTLLARWERALHRQRKKHQEKRRRLENLKRKRLREEQIRREAFRKRKRPSESFMDDIPWIWMLCLSQRRAVRASPKPMQSASAPAHAGASLVTCWQAIEVSPPVGSLVWVKNGCIVCCSNSCRMLQRQGAGADRRCFFEGQLIQITYHCRPGPSCLYTWDNFGMLLGWMKLCQAMRTSYLFTVFHPLQVVVARGCSRIHQRNHHQILSSALRTTKLLWTPRLM